ncbi:MAG: type II toxin-antitoxin system VapC family toxin [Actinobacteria bacterium]|nr:type II toxin-antitoxin system VapC family toxin [Actinomycetota bacterium]
MPKVEYVIDASVAVKWFTQKDETNLEKAIELLRLHQARKCSLVAPNLIIYEVANALRYNRNLKTERVRLAVVGLIKLQMELVGCDEEGFLPRAVDLARENDITLYDAIYLALAKVRRSVLISVDTKMLDKLGATAYAVHLKDLEL